ncbi:MAG TPA: outer membrane beta-barrel protein [Flavipsychrobacter sp.]|nr:outer membrane beta-barrel protein [Flavipsychrobacter sp.]
MKYLLTGLLLFLLPPLCITAQTGRTVQGAVQDTARLPLAGSTIVLVTAARDSITTVTDTAGNFYFNNVEGKKFDLIVTVTGYQGLKRHYSFDNDSLPINLDPILLTPQYNLLKAVKVLGIKPIAFKEDTIEYSMNAYKVRENAPLEDALKKMPGISVDAGGNVTSQGKQVAKVSVNGKEFFGGNVQTAIKNLPAGIVQNVQIVEDYGDQAAITGMKTGESTLRMNIVLNPDKSKGYWSQTTLGDGADLVPSGRENDNRYLALTNNFRFNNDQQISFLGNINNTNVNTFTFNTTEQTGNSTPAAKLNKVMKTGVLGAKAITGPPAGQTTAQNGITEARTLQADMRDQWGKKFQVYGSYNYVNNTTRTRSFISKENISQTNPGFSNYTSNRKDNNAMHNMSWNTEFAPDTLNYLKVIAAYSNTNTHTGYTDSLHSNVTTYTSTAPAKSSNSSFSLSALYNHQFQTKAHFTTEVSFNSTSIDQFQNPQYNFIEGKATAPENQRINTYSRTNDLDANISYIRPLNARSLLETKYAFGRSYTTADKQTDVQDTSTGSFVRDNQLSAKYNFSLTTHRFGLNYRFNGKRFNYVAGLHVQPAELSGSSNLLSNKTKVSTFNLAPAFNLVYNFSRTSTLTLNYSGTTSQPDFEVLQPVIDLSDALYPIQGNPNLKPEFNNSFSLRYNRFNSSTGDLLFANLLLNQTRNKVTTNTVSFPLDYAPDPRLSGTFLTRYLNTNQNHALSAFAAYEKQWSNRQFSIQVNGRIVYNANAAYLTSVQPSTYTESTIKINARNLQLVPGLRFRTDITDVIDVQLFTSYAITRSHNSGTDKQALPELDVRTLTIGLNGKNYFLKNWTQGYGYSLLLNSGYVSTVNLIDPSILNVYVERRFLKDNRGALRLAAFDVFNQNTGFSSVAAANVITQTTTNRLGRYFMLSFTLRLRKFS